MATLIMFGNDMGSSSLSPWVVVFSPNEQAVLRLFCFHYGGGSASIFRNWSASLPNCIEIVAIQLPGREGRYGETFPDSIREVASFLVDELRPMLDKPFVVFGHSLGAYISYEWLRGVQQRHGLTPLLYSPSGIPAPNHAIEDDPISHLSDDDFCDALLRDYGETLSSVLSHQQLREVFIPQLRADFRILEGYRFVPAAQLQCDIWALAGEDEDITVQQLQDWSLHSHGEVTCQRFAGSHFFIHSSEQALLQQFRLALQKIAMKHL